MDSIINAALEEICVRGASGIPMSDLWPSITAVLSASGLPPSDSIKKAIWARLLSLPFLRFDEDGRLIDSQDTKIQSLDESESLGLRIVADEQLRDSFVGLDDLNAANAKISEGQRRTLERIAAARTNGITQCELAKEFGIKGNNFFYQVRNLESQQLIVRQSTTVKEVGNEVDNGQRNNPINTNLMHLYRYAKTVSLNSQQKIEITKQARSDILESVGNADRTSVVGDVPHGKCFKENVLIKDYLPAMKAVCDKLDEANEKILVVSDIKLALGYRKTRGHRAWRNIVNRLEDAGLVEKVQAEVNGRCCKRPSDQPWAPELGGGGREKRKERKKDVPCLRLLKKFDHNDFQSKPIVSTCDGFDTENLVKHGKRGHITDQFLELPMEYRIYDMIDAEGSKGITIFEICRRLGLNPKKMYNRITDLCSKFGMRMESEKPNRTQVYRVWTPKNYEQYLTIVSAGNWQEVPTENELSAKSSDPVPYGESPSNVQLLDSPFQAEDVDSEKQRSHIGEGSELPRTCDGLSIHSQVVMFCMGPQNLAHVSIADNVGKLCTSLSATSSSIVASESPLSVSPTAKRTHWYRDVASTVLGARREQWILKRLKDDNFILYGDLYRWLKDLEKDNKPTMMDRKTLDRALNKLQQDGLCKITQVTIPTVTNFNRIREQGVILHPSIDNISKDLLNQIYKSYRDFEFQCHSRGSAKSANHPVTVVASIERSSNPVDDKPVILEAMRANGYVPAKMVRAKLLHQFLWGYISRLPDWQDTLPSTKDDCNMKNHRKICEFAMAAAIQSMPLELFLQIVGSAKEIDDMVQRCRLGWRLMDLSIPEYKCLLDTCATGRLSCIINILLRLKLIQLVWQGPADVDLVLQVTPTHTMELEPYIEEPLPRVPPSLKINLLDLHPRIRHDFLFSKQEDVNAYWETLEYCYAAADPVSASLSFPGSVVREVFNFRSWTSIRVMTAGKRMELLKRMEIDDLEKQIPFEECVKIARELNLSLEQVLRVSYDKQQRRSQRAYRTSKLKEPVLKKRRSSNDMPVENAPYAATAETSCEPMMSTVPCVDENNMDRDSTLLTYTRIHDNSMEACREESQDNAVDSDTHEEDAQSLSFMKSHKRIRQRKFTWTDEHDRQIVMQYARYRVMMGARFSRVIWSSIHNLPTDPNACGKRMANLKRDNSTWRAVMRLCNLLGERYERHLNNVWRTLGNNTLSLGDSAKTIEGNIVQETVDQNISGGGEDTQASFQQNCWDDFECHDLKMAVDKVLGCKRMAKAEPAKNIGPVHGQGWPDTPNKGTNLDVQEHAARVDRSFISSGHGNKNNCHGERGNNTNYIIPTTAQSRSSSHHFRKKFIKVSNSKGIQIRRKVCESMAVANAVELLKMIFLCNSSAPEVQTLLAETLQLYPKCDLIAALNYLKEKEFVVIGNGNQPPVLSLQYFRNAYSSPFPDDSGKRAASFSSWLHEQDKYLEDGIELSTDIQCGEIFHLFALVSSGHVFISPTLPEEGIGEADESKSLQPFLMMDDENRLKCGSDGAGVPFNGEKDKKQRSQGKVDSDFCTRREKGFPGMKILINRATIPRVDALQCSEHGDNHTFLSTYNVVNRPNYSDTEAISIASSLSRLSSSDNFGCTIQWEAAFGESLCHQMTKYAEHLASTFGGRIEAFIFCSELFKSVCSVIDQAGEQGLSIEEISKVMRVPGVQLTEVVVDTLEVFKLAFKVNAYDCVRVVASSYRSKYFIGLHANPNQDNFMASYMRMRGMSFKRPQQISKEQHDCMGNSENATSMSLSDGHKMTLLDLPPKPGLPRVESVISNECNQVDVSVNRNESGNRLFPSPGVSNVYCSILPWINGDGSMNTVVYKGFTRRILGTVMQNPGILEEDIIRRMDVLNPQSCKRLLETMILDNHLTTRLMYQTATTAPPSILQCLFQSDISKPKQEFRKHYFANPMSTSLL